MSPEVCPPPYKPLAGEAQYPPACALCGGGRIMFGLEVWNMADPKLAEHSPHDTSPMWVTDMRRPFPHGKWFRRDTPEARALYLEAVASAKADRADRERRRLKAYHEKALRELQRPLSADDEKVLRYFDYGPGPDPLDEKSR